MRQLVSRLLQRRSCYAARRPLRRSARPAVEALEDRTLLSAMPQFNLTNPASGGTYGSQVVVLSSGNIVVTDPTVNGNAGAVYLFDGTTGAVISTLSGNAGDEVGLGGVTALSSGNFVVADPAVNNNSGAV